MAVITQTDIKHNGVIIPAGVVIDLGSINMTEDQIQSLLDVGALKEETRRERVMREALEKADAEGLLDEDEEIGTSEGFGGISANEQEGDTEDSTLPGDSTEGAPEVV